ncbi:MAG TPA: TldD/PmbA family protein [bacterium]|nr:TldD/PmbA family protein [bacterium]
MMDALKVEAINKLVGKMKSAGADQADAYFEWGRETEVTARDGEVENLKQSTGTGVGLRVFYQQRVGFGYTSDLTDKGLDDLGERVLAIAKQTAQDENNGLPPANLLQPRNKMPDVFDEKIVALDSEWLAKRAIEMEKIAKAHDPRVKQVDDVGAGSYVAEVALLNSEGLVDRYRKTYVWMYTSVVAEENGDKQSGWFVDQATHLDEMDSAEKIAQEGAQRAVRMLGAKKIATDVMPVIFDPPMAKSFIGGLIEAINGDMIYKKSSFLLDKLGRQIASPLVSIYDDGLLDKRVGSQPFDGEGLPTRRNVIFEQGVLKMYLYDMYTANKAGAAPSGTAARGYDSLPSIGRTNFFMPAGKTSPAEMIKGIKKGLLVNRMMGSGANAVTGDYSRGAFGLLIENGELTVPVQEVTVSGNMLQMLADIDAVGNDLDWRGSIGAPSIRFANLTVSGK